MITRRAWFSGAAALLASVVAGGAWAQSDKGFVRLPNAGVRLPAVAGFEKADSFDGLERRADIASVLVTRIPGPYAEVTRGFNAEMLASRGITLKSKQNVTIDGSPGLLLSVTQKAGGTTFSKWIGAFGGSAETFLVTATFPEENAAQLSAPLKACVLGVRRDNSTPPPKDAGLPFTLTPSSKLKATRSVGKALLYTRDGALPARSVQDPLFIVAPSLGGVLAADRSDYARKRLGKTEQIKGLEVSKHLPIKVDGLSGYETVGAAQDTKTGAPLLVYQTMLFDGDGYILLQGLVGAKQSSVYLPEFRRMTRSLKRK